MNKKLQELKYDLDREADEEKSNELIETYVRVKKSKEDLDKFGTEPEYIKKPGNYWNPANKKKREASIDYLKMDELSESENIARKFHVLFNKAEDDEKNKLCEGRVIKSPGVPVRDILECGTPPISIADARSVLRDALDNDFDFKYSYMANIKMFLYDRTGDLINDQDSYDLLDYILKE